MDLQSKEHVTKFYLLIGPRPGTGLGHATCHLQEMFVTDGDIACSALVPAYETDLTLPRSLYTNQMRRHANGPKRFKIVSPDMARTMSHGPHPRHGCYVIHVQGGGRDANVVTTVTRLACVAAHGSGTSWVGMVFTNASCTLSKSSLWWSCWSIGHNITRCYREISMRRRPWQWDQLGGYGLHQWVLHPQQIKFMVELLEYRTQHNTVLSRD
ncbi:hypothetical protein RRG08_059936 [Elysia crispata]|uniref:Uncharacterized protein n=1 Tax=Elysia crispata TaxID=231223 RepID=A0AAE0Y750_9GAST|nr:hypothetical protein RRG08_059936 [Elysia crispata]